MEVIAPASAEDLALALATGGEQGRSIQISGQNSKRGMAGPMLPADLQVSTRLLKRVLKYEPNDLTISVEAGLAFSQLQRLLAQQGQMVALDPPFHADATVGGVVATNGSGSLRARYGTLRDQIIGMGMATMAGHLVTSGGMVVKNVAGLDMAKVLIGSFGTLAAITSVNFRLHPLPPAMQTFLFSAPSLETVLLRRDDILQGPLQPIGFDLLSPAAAARFNLRGYVLALRAGGSQAVLARYERELPGSAILRGSDDANFWERVREFTPEFLQRQLGGAVVVRIGTRLDQLGGLLRLVTGPCIARAASGVAYVYLSSLQSLPVFWRAAAENNWTLAVEFASDEARALRGASDLWLVDESEGAQNGFAMMKGVKRMFDSKNLLSPSRLYGRI